MVQGKLPVTNLHIVFGPLPYYHPTIWMIVGQGPIALAVGADGGFTLLYFFLPLSGKRPNID